MNADAIVVGAGPGGATAARELAARGYKVLLLDREAFPRDKPCGGAVSPRTAALLPFDITPVVEHVVTGVVLGTPGCGLVARDAAFVLAYMTQRRHLDALLVEHARRAGADFRDGQAVNDVRELPDGTFQVRVEGTTEGSEVVHQARVVIGADGANGAVAGALGFEHPRACGVAIEARVATPHGVPRWLEGRMTLTVPILPGGYGWIFPKRDHVNIGVGCGEAAGPRLRDALGGYARAFGWTSSDLEDVRGHRLPMRHRGMVVAQGGAALVGDAAGLVDPLLGEGMYGAVRSGLAAARAADTYLSGDAPSLSSYQHEVDVELGADLARAHVLAEILNAWPRPLNWLAMHSPAAWELMALLVTGKIAVGGRQWSLGPIVPALAPVAALARLVSISRDGPG